MFHNQVQDIESVHVSKYMLNQLFALNVRIPQFDPLENCCAGPILWQLQQADTMLSPLQAPLAEQHLFEEEEQ